VLAPALVIFVVFVSEIGLVLFLVLFFFDFLQFQRIDARYAKVSATLVAGYDFALVQLILFDIYVRITNRTSHHAKASR